MFLLAPRQDAEVIRTRLMKEAPCGLTGFCGHMGVVLKVLVKKGPLGIHFLKKGILTKQGTYIMAILGTGILNNYHIYLKALGCFPRSPPTQPKTLSHAIQDNCEDALC